MVKENVLFVGDASGGAGNIHGMIQGQFAGTVAASAIRENDISEERLGEYQQLVMDTLGRVPQVGDSVEFQGISFRVDAVARKSVAAVSVTLPAANAYDAPEEVD